MLPSDYPCPRCKCKACYALHRKGLDWVISLIGLRPARCLTCNKRFYARYSIAARRDESDGARQSRTDKGKTDKGKRHIRIVYSRRGSKETA